MNFEKENRDVENIPALEESPEVSLDSQLEQVVFEVAEVKKKIEESTGEMKAYGTDLRLEPNKINSVLERLGYPEKITQLQARFRDALKAAAFAFPVLAASPAFAEQEESREAVVMTQENPDTDAAPENSEGFPDVVTVPQRSYEAEMEKQREAKSDVQQGTQETTPSTESEIEKAKQEIFKEFGEKRVALFQEFATSLLIKGAGSPETQKKLITLLGEELKAGDIPLALAQNFVPFLHGARHLARAFTGKNGEKPLSEFEQMKAFAWGIGSLVVDASTIGYIGKNVLTAKRVISTADRAHATLNYVVSAQEIMEAVQKNKSNPYAQQVVEKVVKMLKKETIVEQGQNSLEKKFQELYDKGLVEVPTFPSSSAE